MNPGNIPRISATFINGFLSLKRILDIQYETASTNAVDIIHEKIAIMKVYLKKHEIQPEEFIFKNSRGGACLYGTFRTQMIEACRENKIANGEYLFQSHDYRHTVATMFYDSHVSLQSIRDYLGHTYEEMTRQYIDYMPQRIAKANDEFFEMQGSSLASWLKKEEKDGK